MSLLRRVIGGVLRRVRLRQGRTLREVAEAAGVSLPYLSEVERGRKEASSEVLAAICRALGISLSELLEQARDDLRRVEPRIPTAPRAALARLDRLPTARAGSGPTARTGPRIVPTSRTSATGRTAPTIRIGFHPQDGTEPVTAAVDPIVVGHATAPLLRLGGSILHVGGPTSPVGSTVGGVGLRVRLVASAPAGRPGPRTARMLARRRARAGRRRLTAG
ncbi:helix-turn-helix domain-containing protein [Micromonospora sp. NPDC000089]|uniref:helix-turn-helix domain-containing protein n=1 Tax=unclassified Micromonospora TaxID=2617518 RepID=UPI0036B1B705